MFSFNAKRKKIISLVLQLDYTPKHSVLAELFVLASLRLVIAKMARQQCGLLFDYVAPSRDLRQCSIMCLLYCRACK